MITHVNVVPLYVSDQDLALEFFVKQLGFVLTTQVEQVPGRWWYEVALPGAQTAIALLDATAHGRRPQPGLTMTLCCDDVAATAAQLSAAGAEVTGPVQQPWGTFAEVTDPDGHLFVLGARPSSADLDRAATR